MQTLPRITIITPSLNQGHLIDETINSVLNQNYTNLEYLILDGGSTDNTLAILRKYNGRVTWISERDRGQSDAINKGLRMATGEIIAFLNSDDLYEPGTLWKVATFFSTHPQAFWLTGRCHTIDIHGQKIRRAITLYKNTWLKLRSYRALFVLNYISQPATFWRRKVSEVVGEFDISLRYAMEYDYWMRIGRSFRLWVLEDYLASFRIHPASKAGSSANAQFDSQFQIVQRYVRSPLFVTLHAIHNAIIVNTYRLLMASQAPVMPMKAAKPE